MGSVLGEHPSGARPAFSDGSLLRGAQTVPLGLPGSVRVDIEQAAQHGEIRLMKDECRRFPEAIVHAVLQVVLSRSQDSAQ